MYQLGRAEVRLALAAHPAAGAAAGLERSCREQSPAAWVRKPASGVRKWLRRRRTSPPSAPLADRRLTRADWNKPWLARALWFVPGKVSGTAPISQASR